MNNVNMTRVLLLNVPLENDYKNTLYFTDKASQESYFLSRKVKEYSDFSYQRKDSFIRVPDHFDNLQNVNYVMYQNKAYSNKWFYAFVVDIKYIDDGRSDIYIETDYIQTWFFDYTVKASFVEREHTNNDTVGIHTVPEQLELGDYIINSINKNKALTSDIVVMGSTIDPSLDSNKKLIGGNVGGGIYNGVRSGYSYFTFLNTKDSVLTDVLKAFSEEGKLDAIGMIFTAPEVLVKTNETKVDNAMVQESDLPTGINWGDGGMNDTPNYKPTSLNGYTPRNKKLLTYPYCYMVLSNNNGGNAIYKYELFQVPLGVERQDLCDFIIHGALTPSMDIICIPNYYNGSDGPNYNECLPGGKYPICGFSGDIYTNWLTQNAMNIAVNLTGNVVQMGAGIGVMGSPLGAVAGTSMFMSGLSGISNSLTEIYQHSLVPIQAQGNVNTGNVKFATNNCTFTVYNMSIKKEYAEIIDKYFDMFGYKTNLVKVPNKAHRSRYWYTKTIDVNIDGAIPNKDMQVIKNCYNNGITFWRNASEIQDYSLSNEIV